MNSLARRLGLVRVVNWCGVLIVVNDEGIARSQMLLQDPVVREDGPP